MDIDDEDSFIREKVRRLSGFDRHPILLTGTFVILALSMMIVIGGTPLLGGAIISLYIFGSIPFGYIFLYLNAREDIPEDRGIIGVAKSFRLGGYRSGVPTVAGEISKAILPLLISYLVFDLDLTITVLLVLSTYIGTNFSLFLRGRGGSGVTIILWSTLVLSPLTILAETILLLISIRLTRDSYLSTIHVFLQLPILLAILERSLELTLFGIVVAMIFITRFSRERDEMKNVTPT
jgi:glycerol-3-phosphate acyltransferase PlsY